MGPDQLRERITEQFSYRGERADIWRVFDLLLETDAFLNLGYSRWYQPHFIGSSQRRLVTELGNVVSAHLPVTNDAHLLDIGCGRGGPALHLAERFGFRVTGVDLVPYNVARARANAAGHSTDVDFVVGDATRLPFHSASLDGCLGIDSFVYLPDRAPVLRDVADVLDSGGVLVFSDLVARSDAAETERRRIRRFAESWDMPTLASRSEYERLLADANLGLRVVEDLTPHSVGRFRKWTTLFLWLYESPAGTLVDTLLARQGLDADTIVDQIRHAHEALPSLRHSLFVAEK